MGCGFCESALSNSAGTLLVDCLVKPVGHQLDYVRGFHDNVEKLKEGKEDLKRARDRLQHEVEEAELGQLQTVEDDVRDLQSKVEHILTDVERLEREIGKNKRCFNWCPNWSWRYQLSKKASKTTLAISQLLEKTAKFGQRVGYRPPSSTLSTIEFLSSKDFVVSEASKSAFNQIIEALEDDNVNMVGLWGMGGVGKTTLVREVGNQAKKLNLFDKVVITTVSQKPNFETIQDEIAKDLLNFSMKNDQGRRSKQELWLRLQKEKRILIILDDVWAKINLKEQIGIPLGEDHKGCRVLLTTRRRQVCQSMECQTVVLLGCLDDHGAWELFEKKAGLQNSDVAIKEVATQVIKKCEGLPIAIVTLGSALKGKNLHRWEAACRRLKNRRLFDIEDMIEENAYLCLELSFDYLNDRETKICFLLCSLFPEDYVIDVEDLVRYSWGLELYKGIGSVEEVRHEVLAAIDILKDSCLLLGCEEGHVKMHDMVRDVALWIASHRKEISFVIKSGVDKILPNDASFEPCMAISFNTSLIAELTEKLVCPNLEILLLGVGGDGGIRISSVFLEGMKALKVCHVHNGFLFPYAFQFQSNLRTLHLTSSNNPRYLRSNDRPHLRSNELGDISSIGMLKELQILRLGGPNISELPNEIGELNNLKLLDISSCSSLTRIPPNLIRRLSQLEELYLGGWKFIKWATEMISEEATNASLSELNSLLYFAALSLEVAPEYIPKDFVFPELKRYDVSIFDRVYYAMRCSISRSLKVEASVLDACKQLIGNVESLVLRNLTGYSNLVPSLELEQGKSTKLTCLILERCEDMKYLLDATMQWALTTSFSNLIQLWLDNMLGFEKLCNGDQPQGFLENLKELRIEYCNDMISAIPVLQNLEEVNVQNCEKIPVLFQIDGRIHTEEEPQLQSLKEVYIHSCNKLTYLFPASMAKSLGSLGQLERLEIHDCLGLKEITQETQVSNINLQSLREVSISGCNNLRSLSSLSHGQVLGNLTKLEIRGCSRLEHTFPGSMAKGLPRLKEICLAALPPLKGSDGNDIVLTLPSLQVLEMENCPQWTPFTISAKIQELRFYDMIGSKKKQLPEVFIPELSQRSPNMKYMKITNFEQLFDDDYNLLSLKKLELRELPDLLLIWNGPIQAVNFDNLTELDIYNCKRLGYIFSPTIAHSLPKLSSLRIFSCEQLEQIIGKGQTSSQGHLLQPLCFPSLTEIWIGGCENLKSILPVSVAHELPKLRELIVQEVSKLEQVFEQGDGANVSNETQKVIQLLQLDRICLHELPSLMSFSPVGYHFVFPSLSEFVVEDCPNVTTSFWVDSRQSVHAKTDQAGHSIDEEIVDESATCRETTWPIGSHMRWYRQ